MKGFSFRCVKNDPGTVSHPRGATDAARRHAVTRIRFYYRTISAPALQETGLLSHRLFLSFRKKKGCADLSEPLQKRVRPSVARVPPKGFSFLRLLSFGMKKRATDGRPERCGVFTGKRVESRTMLRATDGRPYRTKSVFFWVWFCSGENHLRSEGLVACEGSRQNSFCE